VQRPARRAAECDQAAIDQWVARDWPQIKQAPTAQSLAGLLRRKRARSDAQRAPHLGARGQTPTLTHPFNWKKAVALCYGVRGGGAQLCVHVTAGNDDTDRLIEVLKELRRFLGGEKATLLWDGLPSHRSTAMRDWIRIQRSWLVVERLLVVRADPHGNWPASNLKSPQTTSASASGRAAVHAAH
jgi:hypothetical protein